MVQKSLPGFVLHAEPVWIWGICFHQLVRQAAARSCYKDCFLKESTRQMSFVSLVRVTKASQITGKAEMKIKNENN